MKDWMNADAETIKQNRIRYELVDLNAEDEEGVADDADDAAGTADTTEAVEEVAAESVDGEDEAGATEGGESSSDVAPSEPTP